jgi:hypothetical protein
MLPDLNGVPVEEMMWLKRESLMREFEQIRMVRAARISNPGLIERAWLYLGRVLVQAGQRISEQYVMPRQTYLDSTARFAA